MASYGRNEIEYFYSITNVRLLEIQYIAVVHMYSTIIRILPSS
jgi:hypothetical protein